MVAQVGDQVEQPAYQPATGTFTAPFEATIAVARSRSASMRQRGQGYAETPQTDCDSRRH
jgi:hypothetical protein